ncbi:hypothetical protein PIROE2DRAFT_18197, partial [Piromyces sp. E2]
DKWIDVEKSLGDDANSPIKGNYNQFLNPNGPLKKRNPNLQVLISVGGWTWSKDSESNIMSSAVYQNEEDVANEVMDKDTKKDDMKISDHNIESTGKEHATTSDPKTSNQTNLDMSGKDTVNQSSHNAINNNEIKSNTLENTSELVEKTNSINKIEVKEKQKSSGLDEKIHHHSTDLNHKYYIEKEIIDHESYIEKDTSEEFYKGICGNYYRYESDESSESVYSDLELLPNIGKANKGSHRKQISMSYPSVSEGQSIISFDKISNEQNLYCNRESPIEEEQKEFDQDSPDIKITNNDNNNGNNNLEPYNKKLKEGEGSIHSQYLQIDKKAMLHKEYSSDGDVTDHDNAKSNVPNNAFSDRAIKKLTKENDENHQSQDTKLYHQLIENVKDCHKNEIYSESSIVNIGIHGSNMSNDVSRSSKTEITNLNTVRDISERVNITDIGEDKDSLKTASIEDCTSQINVEEEEVEVDGYDDVVDKDAVNIVVNKPDGTESRLVDGCNPRCDENLDCILEEKYESNHSDGKKHSNDDSDSFYDKIQLMNDRDVKNKKIYLKSNASVPDNLNVKTNSYERRRGHEKTNSYNCNDVQDFKYLQPLNEVTTSTNSGFSTISGSISYSSNLFGTYRSDNSDKNSEKVNKYFSLRSESKNNSKSNSLKVRNSTRDIYGTFKKSEPRYRLDKSLNGSISKRSKKPLNIQFMAKYLKDDNNGEEEEVSEADISSRLTAKEFAKLVGINILYDDDEKEEIADLQKQGINRLSPNTHQPIDLSMFVPPNPTELATLHNTMPKPAPSDAKPNNYGAANDVKKDITIDHNIKKSITNIFSFDDKSLRDEIEPTKEARTAPSTRNKFDFIINSKQPLHPTTTDFSDRHLNSEPVEINTISLKTTPSIQPAQVHTEKEVTIKTQSTVSAKGRTFEVSYTSNTEFPERNNNKPNTLGSQGSKVRNSKTEPNIHNEYSQSLSSIENNKNGNIKSTTNIRNTIPSVSIVHGGPSEEMCRSILEKANPIIKLDRENRSIMDSPMTDIDNDCYSVERIKLGETQTRPLGPSLLHTVQNTSKDEQKVSPIITASIPNGFNSSNTTNTTTNTTTTTNTNSMGETSSTDPKVITYNKPLISNNTKVIFFKSKRNNYINLQSTNIDGNKHRQLHKRRFEVRSSATDDKFNKANTVQSPENGEENDEINNKEKINEDVPESSMKRNSIFYSSTSPTIKNLRTFSFISHHQNSSSSLNSPHLLPSKPGFINTDHILSPFSPLTPDPIEEDNEYEDADSHHSISSHTLISGNSNMFGLQSPTQSPSKPLQLQSPLSYNLPSQETSHTLVLPGNLSSNGESKNSSLIEASQSLSKSHVVTNSPALATPSSSTSGNTHTVITMSSPNSNQAAVITTTKTTTSNHTFITTKTTNIPISSLLIDTNSINTTSSRPSSVINSENCIRDEMMMNITAQKINSNDN